MSFIIYIYILYLYNKFCSSRQTPPYGTGEKIGPLSPLKIFPDGLFEATEEVQRLLIQHQVFQESLATRQLGCFCFCGGSTVPLLCMAIIILVGFVYQYMGCLVHLPFLLVVLHIT